MLSSTSYYNATGGIIRNNGVYKFPYFTVSPGHFIHPLPTLATQQSRGWLQPLSVDVGTKVFKAVTGHFHGE